jgi:hypothetical protein
VLFAVVYNVLFDPASMIFHVTLGPFYGKAGSLADSFYYTNHERCVRYSGN